VQTWRPCESLRLYPTDLTQTEYTFVSIQKTITILNTSTIACNTKIMNVIWSDPTIMYARGQHLTTSWLTRVPDYTELQPRRQTSSYSPPWEPQILPRCYLLPCLNIKLRQHKICRTESPCDMKVRFVSSDRKFLLNICVLSPLIPASSTDIFVNCGSHAKGGVTSQIHGTALCSRFPSLWLLHTVSGSTAATRGPRKLLLVFKLKRKQRVKSDIHTYIHTQREREMISQDLHREELRKSVQVVPSNWNSLRGFLTLQAPAADHKLQWIPYRKAPK
jgi:hypothetical protein